MNDPIFSTSLFFNKIEVYNDHILYKQFLLGEIRISVKQIASIKMGMPLTQKITIETAGGKRYRMLVRLRDKKKLRDAIYQIME